MDKIWLKVNETAELLGVGRSFVYELIHQGPHDGGLASVKLGHMRRVPLADVHRWAREREQAGKSR